MACIVYLVYVCTIVYCLLLLPDVLFERVPILSAPHRLYCKFSYIPNVDFLLALPILMRYLDDASCYNKYINSQSRCLLLFIIFNETYLRTGTGTSRDFRSAET